LGSANWGAATRNCSSSGWLLETLNAVFSAKKPPPSHDSRTLSTIKGLQIVTQFVIRFNLTFVAPLNKCGNSDEKPIAHGHVACGFQRGVGIGGGKAY
jgi:hypothetical protein